MTSDDIIDLIDVMSAAWPWAEWTPAQTDLWCGALEPVERADAAVAVRRAVFKLDKPPSIAWVLGEARNESERRTTTVPALPPSPADRAGRARLVAELKTMLSEPRPHDHHNGWEGCATCVASVERYGLNPPPTRQPAVVGTPPEGGTTEEPGG
jgi:hypothetical protein